MTAPVFGGYSLQEALDGLHAYDSGCVDSGISDVALRLECAEYIDRLPTTERRLVLSRIVRDLYLTDEALDQGYGWEDAMEFGMWIDEGAYKR